MTPSHPGSFIKRQLFDPLNLEIEAISAILDVDSSSIVDLINENAPITADMALRIEKAFDIKMDFLLRMQALYDASQARKHENAIHVERYQPA